MRFPSGVTDQYIYFVAVDSTDFTTRETGLSSFTVYRARNGAAAAAYTTPTIAEVSAANMPGVYSLLLDEDMTIGSGNDSEEVVLHITQASMAPVTIKFELYRNIITAGETLVVASGIGDADVEKWLGQTVAAVTVNGVPEVDVTHWRGTAAAAPTTAGVPAVEVIDIAAAGQTDIRSAVDAEVAAIKAKTDSLTFTVAGQVDANMLSVSGDGPAADNIEAAFDGTGYVDDKAPSTQEQVGHIAVTGAALNLSAASFTLTTGTQTAGTVTNTASVDASYHQLTDAAGTLDCYYQFDVGTDGVPVGATITGHVTSVAGNVAVYAYNWGAAAWNQVGSITARVDTADQIYTFDLLTVHVGTGANDGLVRVRFQGSGLTTLNLYVDQIFASYARIAPTAAEINAEVDTALNDYDGPTNAELATALAAADDAVLAAIAALNNLSAAQVNAEVVDALNVDTYAEPGQGTPAATASLVAKIGLLAKLARNKSTVTATQHSIFNDDAVTVDHKRTLSDDATTFTSGELATGP